MEKIWWLPLVVSLVSHFLHHHSCEGHQFYDTLGSASASYVTDPYLHNCKMMELQPFQKLLDDCEKLLKEEDEAHLAIVKMLDDYNRASNDLDVEEKVVYAKWKTISEYVAEEKYQKRFEKIGSEIKELEKQIAGRDESLKAQEERINGLSAQKTALEEKRAQLDKSREKALQKFWPDKVLARKLKQVPAPESRQELNEKRERIQTRLNTLSAQWDSTDMEGVRSLLKAYDEACKEVWEKFGNVKKGEKKVRRILNPKQLEENHQKLSALRTEMSSWKSFLVDQNKFLKEANNKLKMLRLKHTT